ncbi:hypothetical protein ACHAWF_013287 [Thalassiosira exigua]
MSTTPTFTAHDLAMTNTMSSEAAANDARPSSGGNDRADESSAAAPGESSPRSEFPSTPAASSPRMADDDGRQGCARASEGQGSDCRDDEGSEEGGKARSFSQSEVPEATTAGTRRPTRRAALALAPARAALACLALALLLTRGARNRFPGRDDGRGRRELVSKTEAIPSSPSSAARTLEDAPRIASPAASPAASLVPTAVTVPSPAPVMSLNYKPMRNRRPGKKPGKKPGGKKKPGKKPNRPNRPRSSKSYQRPSSLGNRLPNGVPDREPPRKRLRLHLNPKDGET